MRLATINARGCHDYGLFRHAMEECSINILCLTETHRATESLHHTTNRGLHITGPCINGSSTIRRGGVSLLSDDKCKLRYKAHLRRADAQVLVATADTGLVVIGTYISPVRGSEVICAVLDWISPWMRGEAVVFGDMNARHLRWDSDTNAYGTSLQRWAEERRARVFAPNEKTCVTALGASTIDIFVSRSPRLDNIHIVPGMWDLLTDHNLVVAQVCPKSEDAQIRIPRRLFQNPRVVRKAADMYKSSLPEVTDSANVAQTPAELELAVNQWQATMLRPWLQYSHPTPARFRPGWSRELDRLASQRTRLLKRASKGDQAARLAAKTIDKEIKRRQRARKRALERSTAEDAERQLDRNAASEIDGMVRAAITAEDVSRRPTPATYLAYLQASSRTDTSIKPSNFELDVEFESTLAQAIMEMATGRAAGPDGITARVLKVDPVSTANSLCAIWRAVGRLCYVPKALSLGRVTPVFKKGDPLDPSNYRPICVLNVMRRAMSAAVDRRVRRKLTFHPRQWGFRKNTGTEHAIAHLEARRRRGFKHMAVLDLKGAYDKTPRNSLLEMIRSRLPSGLAGIISAMLSPGEMYVSGDSRSRIRTTSGVPQGDPLSPTLFNIFMDDFLHEMDRCVGAATPAASCYADDVVLLTDSRSGLQHCMNAANIWSTKNYMEWNVAKCAELIPVSCPPRPSLHLSQQQLPQSELIQYLGVYVNWDGISSHSLHNRLDLALRRMACIAKALSLSRLSYDQRQYIILTHVFSLADYAAHLCPLPASVRCKAATLERRACAWVLDHPVRSHQLIRARTMSRLPSMEVRRKISAIRRTHGARIAISLDEPHSTSSKRAMLFLEHHTMTPFHAHIPQPQAKLSTALAAILTTEWKRTVSGRRPVPTSGKLTPSFRNQHPRTLHTLSAFYLNSIPVQAWHQIAADQRASLVTLLKKERITKRERHEITVSLKKLTRHM